MDSATSLSGFVVGMGRGREGRELFFFAKTSVPSEGKSAKPLTLVLVRAFFDWSRGCESWAVKTEHFNHYSTYTCTCQNSSWEQERV